MGGTARRVVVWELPPPLPVAERLMRQHEGQPALQALGKPCHDCAVTNGFYTPYSEELAGCTAEVQAFVSARWFCHNHRMRACRGNIDFLAARARGEKEGQ